MGPAPGTEGHPSQAAAIQTPGGSLGAHLHDSAIWGLKLALGFNSCLPVTGKPPC